jgi:hypothetical protein
MLVVALGAVIACGGENTDTRPDTGTDTIEGSGVVVTETRSVEAFHGLRLDNVGRVVLSPAAAAGVVVEADDNIVESVRTAVVDGVLEVGLAPGSYSDITLVFHVSAPLLDRLELTGAGTIAGTVADVASLDVVISGSGSVTLAGTAEQATVTLSGAGAFHGYDLLAAECVASLDGAGLVEVTASDSLDATVDGLGSIRYDGAPALVRRQVTGLGSIQPR